MQRIERHAAAVIFDRRSVPLDHFRRGTLPSGTSFYFLTTPNDGPYNKP
jgi:hypothetical protein